MISLLLRLDRLYTALLSFSTLKRAFSPLSLRRGFLQLYRRAGASLAYLPLPALASYVTRILEGNRRTATSSKFDIFF